MPLPVTFPGPTFKVTGNLYDILGPNNGADLLVSLPKARLVFTPNFTGPVVWDGDLYWIKPVGVAISSDGSISDPDDPILLLANDAGLNVAGIQWQVEIRIQGSVVEWWFDAPADGGTVDLGSVAHSPGVSANSIPGLTEAALLSLIEDAGSDVHGAIIAIGGGAVSSVAGKTGAVTLAKADVGLGNVDNTSDANKPVSTAQAAADALKAPIASPTFTGTVSGVTKAMVGLGSVDNTADSAKPVSTAQAAALGKKVEVVTYSGSLGTTRPTADAVYWVDYPSNPTNAQPQDIVATTATTTISGQTLDNTNTITVKDTSLTLQDATDTTKRVQLDVNSSQATSTTRTIVLPDSTGQLATLALTETLVNKTLNGCTINAPTGLAKTDVGLGNLTNVAQTPLDATLNAQTGTTYTLVAGDDGKVITLNNAAAITLTVPQNSAAAIPIGAYIEFIQLGAGQVTFAAGTGATLNSRGAAVKINGQYGTAALRKIATNTFILAGDLA